MIAYACNPKGGGEHWLGWGWAEQAARGYQVDLITTPNHQKAVEERAKQCGINAHFVGLPRWFRDFSENFGQAGGWSRKMWWQYRAAKLARKLHLQKPFDLVHQTTFHTFRVPFLAARLGIPAVWGPIAGGESVPRGFSRFLGGGQVTEFKSKCANSVWLHFPPVTKSLRRASIIFVSNSTTLGFLPVRFRGKCRIIAPNALRPEDEKPKSELPIATPGPTLRLLYVGNCVATRVVPLVFDALVESGLSDYKMTVVGGGPAVPEWRQWAARRGISEKVEFAGLVPYETLSNYYASADALVFPALRDSGGSALLEAMSRNLPVICLDWAGPGEMVEEGCGIKIPVHDPVQTVTGFAAALRQIQSDPALRISMARAARQRAQAVFRWDEKYRLLRATYESLFKS